MLYRDFLKTVTECPFCTAENNRIFKENDLAYLTYSLAPYHKHHLLVIPKRHIDSFSDLVEEEHRAILALLEIGSRALEKLNYDDSTIFVRNGKNLLKSVEHLHYHIVPAQRIGDLDIQGKERRIMSEEEVKMVMEEIGKVL